MTRYYLGADHNHTTDRFKRVSSEVSLSMSLREPLPNTNRHQGFKWLLVMIIAMGAAVAAIPAQTSVRPVVVNDRLQLISNKVCGDSKTAIWINAFTIECLKEIL